MKKLMVVASLFAISAFAGEFKGAISESGCGAKHVAGSAADIKCVSACVKKGSAPVFVSDGKVMKIADSSKVMDYLGKKVVVTGSVDGDTVTIDSVKADE
jgi:hypothetical protein